ncbi:MAG: hypothetical protein JXM70_06175 [Pirellulales bacterium]|nr:hypothetical protein [Pirellulales bacterium]
MSFRLHNKIRFGYTLLEVILASMLAAAIMLIVATSIEIQLRAFKSGSSHVEEAQLARTLLHKIGDDLRALMPMEAATGSPDSAASTEDKDSDTRGGDSEMDSKDTADETDESDDKTTSDVSKPGIYGEIDYLRIDVVKAQRRVSSSSDELPSDAAAQGANSAIQTIVYYVQTPEELAVEAVSTNSDQSGGGLVRRELVQPAAAWAANTGSLEYEDATVMPIASEVTAIEFRYHDGEEWLEAWDSSESGEFPKAIEIRLFFARQTRSNSNPTATAGYYSNEQNGLPDVQYRLIVPIACQGASESTKSDSLDESSEPTTSSDGSESSGGER